MDAAVRSPSFASVVAFQDVECADQHDSAGRGRRRADDRVVVEGADDGLALDHVVLGKVVEREQSAAFLEFVDQLMRQLSAVEIVGIGGNACSVRAS